MSERPIVRGIRHAVGLIRRRRELEVEPDGSECCVCAAWADGARGLILDAAGQAIGPESDDADGVGFAPICEACAGLHMQWVFEPMPEDIGSTNEG